LANKRLKGTQSIEASLRIVFIERHEHADPPHAVGLLRSRTERSNPGTAATIKCSGSRASG
jgi:hypothetical protein